MASEIDPVFSQMGGSQVRGEIVRLFGSGPMTRDVFRVLVHLGRRCESLEERVAQLEASGAAKAAPDGPPSEPSPPAYGKKGKPAKGG